MYDEIRCPWCGETITDLWEYDLEIDGVEYECDNCFKPIVIGYEISYWITKGNEEE